MDQEQSPSFKPYQDIPSPCQPSYTLAAIERIWPALTEQGVMRIGIFGSVARGDASINSDVDCLVELTDTSSLIDLIAVKQLLEETLGCSVDVVTPRGLKADIRDSVLCEVRHAA